MCSNSSRSMHLLMDCVVHFCKERRIIRLKKGAWQLMVQPEAYNTLLQRLPQSIGIICLSRMKQYFITHCIKKEQYENQPTQTRSRNRQGSC